MTLPPTDAPVLTVPANSTGSLTASWTAIAVATSYQLQQRKAGGSWSAVHDAAERTKTISGLTAGTYEYRVRGCNSGGCGPFSVTRSTLVTLPPTNPPVWGTIPGSNTSGTYTVSWGSAATATSYELQERINGGSWSTLQNAAERTRELAGKATGSYGYRVRACNLGGCGPYSSVVTVAVQIAQPPAGAPTLEVPGILHEGVPFTATWTAVAGAGTYRLETQFNGGTWYELQNSSARSRDFPGGNGAGIHRYRVRACNASGCGSWSTVRAMEVLGGQTCPIQPCEPEVPLRVREGEQK